MAERAVFLDRDNTIIENDGYLGEPSRVKLLPGAATALTALRALGYRLIVVSNQSGVARGMFNEDAVEAVNKEMSRQLLEQGGAHIDASYYCPYHPEAPIAEYRADHEWRKPKPGMLKQAAVDFNLDLAGSWMVGDMYRDVAAGVSAGCRTILLQNPDIANSTEPEKDRKASEVSPHFVVRTLADAARIIAREGRAPHGGPAGGTSPASAVLAEAVAPAPAGLPTAVVVNEEAIAEKVARHMTARTGNAGMPSAGGAAGSAKLEQTLTELLTHLRHQNRSAELHTDFSMSDVVTLVVQGLAVVAMIIGLALYFTAPETFPKTTTIVDMWVASFKRQNALLWVMAAVFFQGAVIALLLRKRNKR